MYAPGTRRHIKAALKLGATMDEIMEVLKLCVVQGVQSCNMGVPILARGACEDFEHEIVVAIR
jgi:alkylhydroperoxidase/carboxymuconolactone decarboxylase family protein YurZ